MIRNKKYLKLVFMAKLLIIVIFLITTISCSSKKSEDLKSPCVGIENSPCGERRAVNFS